MAAVAVSLAEGLCAAEYTIEREGRAATVRAVRVGGEELLELGDVAGFFDLRLVRDGRKEVELRGADGVLRIRAGRSLVLVDDKPVLLQSEVRLHDGRLLVPVDFVTRAVARLVGGDVRLDLPRRAIRFERDSALVGCETFGDRTRVTLATPVPPVFAEVVREGRRRIVTLTNQELPAQLGGCAFDETLADLSIEPGGGQTRITFFVGPLFEALKIYELPEAGQLVFDFFNESGIAQESVVPAPAPPTEAFDTVVLDPGHGGEDIGAVGPGGLREKDLTLAIAQQVARLLRERAGLTVLLTREADEARPLMERTTLANQAQADLFLSIHANATVAPNAWGAETYFLHLDATDEASRTLAAFENDATGLRSRGGGGGDLEVLLWDMAQQQYLEESSLLAETVQLELNELAGTRDRGVKQANFLVLRGATMPAVLVEVGFLSSPREEAKMRTAEFQVATAEALARAVLAFRARRQARLPE